MRKYTETYKENTLFHVKYSCISDGSFLLAYDVRLANLISRKLDELHRLSRHAILKNVFIFLRHIYFNYTDMSYLLPLSVRIWYIS